MKSHLKVKVVSMGMEMTYIRKQEAKWKTRAREARRRQQIFIRDPEKHGKAALSQTYAEANFWSHHWHRYDLKVDARHAHLAYGAMKGIPYSKIEHYCHGWRKGHGGYEPNWKAVTESVERFSKDEPNPQDYMQKFAEWVSEAKTWFEGNEQRWNEKHQSCTDRYRLSQGCGGDTPNGPADALVKAGH